MLMKRRDKPGLGECFRIWLWPRRSWRRSWNYVQRRVWRLSGSPHSIALGFAAGAFASFTPFIGFHFVIGFIIAYFIRGNILASALGTFIGNPLSFPFIWFTTYTFGSYLLGIEVTHSATSSMPMIELSTLWTDSALFWKEFWEQAWPVVKPMLVGGFPIGLVVGTICYIPILMAVTAYQAKRRARLSRIGRNENSSDATNKETSL